LFLAGCIADITVLHLFRLGHADVGAIALVRVAHGVGLGCAAGIVWSVVTSLRWGLLVGLAIEIAFGIALSTGNTHASLIGASIASGIALGLLGTDAHVTEMQWFRALAGAIVGAVAGVILGIVLGCIVALLSGVTDQDRLLRIELCAAIGVGIRGTLGLKRGLEWGIGRDIKWNRGWPIIISVLTGISLLVIWYMVGWFTGEGSFIQIFANSMVVCCFGLILCNRAAIIRRIMLLWDERPYKEALVYIGIIAMVALVGLILLSLGLGAAIGLVVLGYAGFWALFLSYKGWETPHPLSVQRRIPQGLAIAFAAELLGIVWGLLNTPLIAFVLLFLGDGLDFIEGLVPEMLGGLVLGLLLAIVWIVGNRMWIGIVCAIAITVLFGAENSIAFLTPFVGLGLLRAALPTMKTLLREVVYGKNAVMS
jgi:hypothetical protein